MGWWNFNFGGKLVARLLPKVGCDVGPVIVSIGASTSLMSS